MLKVRVLTRSGKVRKELEMNTTDRVGELKKRFFKDEGVNVNRQRFTIKSNIPGVTDKIDKKTKLPIPVVLTNDEKTLAEYGISKDMKVLELEFKDLGPQVGWQTVFLVEYFGPFIAHALPYYFPGLFYGSSNSNTSHSLTQQLAFALVIFHYLKREFETIFIHRFSNETMPWVNIFKNCSHYWLFGGICISYFLYHPKYTAPWSQPAMIYGLGGLMVLCELGNLHAHYTLRNLRPAGTKERGIPKGQLFELVSCANYTWELGSWVCFGLLTNCLTSWVFLVLSFLPMYSWALKKQKKYKEEFPNYPKRRKAIIPFIL